MVFVFSYLGTSRKTFHIRHSISRFNYSARSSFHYNIARKEWVSVLLWCHRGWKNIQNVGYNGVYNNDGFGDLFDEPQADSRVQMLQTEELNVETQENKRHYRQRSRVHKLEYVVELEKIVNFYVTLVIRVAHLLQLPATLPKENGESKRQLAKLLQQKLVVGMQLQNT